MGATRSRIVECIQVVTWNICHPTSPYMGMLATRCVVGVEPYGQVYRNGFERQREDPSGNPLRLRAWDR